MTTTTADFFSSQDYPQTPTAPSAAPAGYTTPATLDDPGQDPSVSSEQLASYRSQFINLIVQEIVSIFTGSFIPGLGDAESQLGAWVNSTLPAQITAPLQALVNLLVSILAPFPIIGNVATDLASAFGLLNDQTTTAQDTANTATSGVAALSAQLNAGTSGALITDTFDRASASNLGSDWDQSYSSGSGTLGTDGNGNQHWTAAGSGSRTCVARYQTIPTNTDTQSIQVVLNAALEAHTINPEYSLCGRMDSGKANYIQALIDHNSCEIGYVVGGTYTRIGSAVSTTSSAGDLWELRCGTYNGTSGDDYEFLLLQNGVTKVDVTDSGHVSQMGSSYRYPGQVASAGTAVVGLLTQQKAPPDAAVFTATDYTPS